MKARVKATGEIVEIAEYSTIYAENYDTCFYPLEHQAAIAAMQGLVTRGEVLGSSVQEIARDIAEISCEVAHALVEKYKKEE